MNWDNYYHDGADEINQGEYDEHEHEHEFDIEDSYHMFDFAKYLIDNNITIDWLNPDSYISSDEAAKKFFNIEFHISKTYPTDIGYSKPPEYYFERIFKAISLKNGEAKVCYIQIADEYEFKYKTVRGKFGKWEHVLYTFIFHEKDSIDWMDKPIWKDSLAAEGSPADTICIRSIPQEDDEYRWASFKFGKKFDRIGHIDKDDLEYLMDAGAISLFELDKFGYVS